MNADDKRVMAAVIQLRWHLDEAQAEFAERCGWSPTTIAAYEKTRAPKGKALLELDAIAFEAGRGDLQLVFQEALSEELGAPYQPTHGLARQDVS